MPTLFDEMAGSLDLEKWFVRVTSKTTLELFRLFWKTQQGKARDFIIQEDWCDSQCFLIRICTSWYIEVKALVPKFQDCAWNHEIICADFQEGGRAITRNCVFPAMSRVLVVLLWTLVVLHVRVITWCFWFGPHLPQAMKYANLDQRSPLWDSAIANIFWASWNLSSSSTVHVTIMLPAVCWAKWLAPLLYWYCMPPTVETVVCEVSSVLATKHDFAGRMLSSDKRKADGITIYHFFLRQETPCMQ